MPHPSGVPLALLTTAALPALDAQRAWMLLVVDYIATKKIIAPALNSMVGGPTQLFKSSGAQIKGAIGSLVRRAIETGDIRADLEPLDLLRALVGVSNVSVAEFSSQADLLNLRTANSAITAQVDHAFTSATIRGGDVSAFTQSDNFAQLKTLRLESVDQADLLLLAQHLLAHPRPKLVIDFAQGSRLTWCSKEVSKWEAMSLCFVSTRRSRTCVLATRNTGDYREKRA